MQAIFETLFDLIYLSTVITLGFKMIFKSRGNKQYRLFGLMAVILGFGDAFHLVPRAYALCTTGLEDFEFQLGVGKLVTSITMTIFYIILYHILLKRYDLKNHRFTTLGIYFLAFIRISLCFFPQNAWTSADSPLSWGIYRNIPFAIMGIIIIVLFYKQSKRTKDKTFKHMWLAITLSFALYIPVVLWADIYPLVGILMIPKTIAYVWIVFMGYIEMRKS